MLSKLRIWMVLLPVFLTSCSYIPTPGFLRVRDTEYLKARSAPPLRIPPGVSSSSFHDDYPVPNRNYPAEAKAVKLTPPGLEN